MTTSAELDAPVSYIQRTRDYYLTLGYNNPYRWAHFDDVPFAPLRKPLAEARLTLITTAAPLQPDGGDQGPDAPYNGHAKFFRVFSASTDDDPDLRISHVVYDRDHTSAEDQNTWFPLARLREVAEAGRIAGLTSRFHCAPTNRSQRVTSQVDAPELLKRCQEDGADAVILVPN